MWSAHTYWVCRPTRIASLFGIFINFLCLCTEIKEEYYMWGNLNSPFHLKLLLKMSQISSCQVCAQVLTSTHSRGVFPSRWWQPSKSFLQNWPWPIAGSLLPWSILLGFFPRHRGSAVKDHRKLVCAESFHKKSSFLIDLPRKMTSFPPDQLCCPDCTLAASFQCNTLPPDAGMTSKFSSPSSSPSLQIILNSFLPVSPIWKYKPRLFLESSIYPATCLEWYL